MHVGKLLGAILFGLAATTAHAAGLRTLDIPADANGPAIKGAVWYPCSQPPGRVDLGLITLPAVKDCALPGEGLPLILISHGRSGSFVGHHDIAEVLADAGFVVAAINHPGDTASDLSRTEQLSIFVERPNHIRRLIDFMLGASALAANIDRDRIGFFGFSRGGHTGLVLIGAKSDFASAASLCQQSTAPFCAQILRREFPAQPMTHDPRIKAAVIADPRINFFTADSFATIKIPVQLWASEYGGDGVLPHSVDLVDNNLPAKHEYHAVSNAGHFAFLAPCAPEWAKEIPELCVDKNGFDRVAFHTQFNANALAFFRTHLPKASH